MGDIFAFNWGWVVLGILAIVTLLYLYKRGNEDLVKKIILSLVVRAEKTLGSKTGELKYAMVVNLAYKHIPSSLRLFFSKKEIDNMIEEAVRFLKEYLSEGRDLMGYDDEIKKMLYDNENL
ncbi:hypothetical protein [Caldisalinibacter kiritimatiensis]|uniref:Uncharacterized protein n=1 Tax=Caldisalinibacter kiritimatiensis TaxID=1304284 RepID=R1CRV3_9FIRM|nr:hypothetical protein [Caldisalinibacter kiritimatiensis]EOD01401.1 hypothetical protein L21TH_0547 [Caldisalinibacter kiritimatiensis]